MNTIFKENEIPTTELQAVGLHDGKRDLLSEDIKEQLLRGQVTDFVTLKDVSVNNEKLDIDSKLSLHKTENGTNLLFHPIYAKEQKHNLLSSEEQHNFKNGVNVKHISAHGKLIDYGDAPYKFDQKNKDSFYIKLEKSNGQIKELWGVDLKDALKKSGFRRGDSVQIDHIGVKPTKTQIPQLDENKNVVGNKWIEVQRNDWKVSKYEQKNEKEESILFEYDQDTKSFAGKSSKNIIVPEAVNGEELTAEQKRKYREGEQVKLEDDTVIQASPIFSMKFNRRLAIASIMFDGGLSYLLFKATEKWIEKNKVSMNAYTNGYKEAMNKVQADLEQKQKSAPNSTKIANDLNIIKQEINKANISSPIISTDKSIDNLKEKINDPELERNALDHENDLKEKNDSSLEYDQNTSRKR